MLNDPEHFKGKFHEVYWYSRTLLMEPDKMKTLYNYTNLLKPKKELYKAMKKLLKD
jgi:hypothetical protein